MLVVVGDGGRGALVVHDLALDLLPVGEAEALDRERDDPALVDRAAPHGLEAAVGGAHGAWILPASAVPAASAAAKNSGSSASARPIVRAGRPLAA